MLYMASIDYVAYAVGFGRDRGWTPGLGEERGWTSKPNSLEGLGEERGWTSKPDVLGGEKGMDPTCITYMYAYC